MAKSMDSQHLMQMVETDRARRTRERAGVALHQGVTIFGFAVGAFGMLMIYRLMGDVSISLGRAMGELSPADFYVSGALLEPEAAEVIAAYWEANPDPGKGKFGWVIKMRRFYRLIKKIGDDGNFQGYTRDYNFLKKAEDALVRSGYMSEEDAVPPHPVDAFADRVLESKWYWGGAMAAAALPGALLGVRILREMRESREHKA